MTISFIRHRGIIFDMWRTELKRKYAGTLLGPIWAVAPQILTVAAYWFVFEVGLKVQGAGPVPYFFYFTLGIVPWFLFFDTFSTSVNAVRDNRHLITKILFPSEILPLISFLVASVPHLALLGVLVVMLKSNDLLSVGNLPWLLYFYLCIAVLALGIGWLASAVSVFVSDIAHFAQMAVGLLFWVTPIMWHVEVLPEDWHWVFDWNPLSYLVNGYRFALAGGAPPDAMGTLRFWVVALVLATLGRQVFMNLKHHFADVL
jgi:lipopolysaccharide transport system permease protein/teichoic acid transport system permease protein